MHALDALGLQNPGAALEARDHIQQGGNGYIDACCIAQVTRSKLVHNLAQ